jgi:hypothetical protein
MLWESCRWGCRSQLGKTASLMPALAAARLAMNHKTPERALSRHDLHAVGIDCRD